MNHCDLQRMIKLCDTIISGRNINLHRVAVYVKRESCSKVNIIIPFQYV